VYKEDQPYTKLGTGRISYNLYHEERQVEWRTWR